MGADLYSNLFQFLNVAIKMSGATIEHIIVITFQFLNGAIKMAAKVKDIKPLPDFNSLMVRLKSFVTN